MARRRRTLEETSALNAQRFNTQHRERLPLFMQAGLEEDLLARGVLRDRPADHLARVHTAYVAWRSGTAVPGCNGRSRRTARRCTRRSCCGGGACGCGSRPCGARRDPASRVGSG